MTAEAVRSIRRRLRSKPFDHPGNDVGERLRVLQVTITLDWHDPNPKERQRGEKTYPREDVPKHRTYRTALSPEHVDRDHRAQVVHAVMRFLWNQLNADDWPGERLRIDTPRRPGV